MTHTVKSVLFKLWELIIFDNFTFFFFQHLTRWWTTETWHPSWDFLALVYKINSPPPPFLISHLELLALDWRRVVLLLQGRRPARLTWMPFLNRPVGRPLSGVSMYWVRHQRQRDIGVCQIVCETVPKRFLPQTSARRRVKRRSKGRVPPQSSHQDSLRKTKLQILPGFFFSFKKNNISVRVFGVNLPLWIYLFQAILSFRSFLRKEESDSSSGDSDSDSDSDQIGPPLPPQFNSQAKEGEETRQSQSQEDEDDDDDEDLESQDDDDNDVCMISSADIFKVYLVLYAVLTLKKMMKALRWFKVSPQDGSKSTFFFYNICVARCDTSMFCVRSIYVLSCFFYLRIQSRRFQTVMRSLYSTEPNRWVFGLCSWLCCFSSEVTFNHQKCFIKFPLSFFAFVPSGIGSGLGPLWSPSGDRWLRLWRALLGLCRHEPGSAGLPIAPAVRVVSPLPRRRRHRRRRAVA